MACLIRFELALHLLNMLPPGLFWNMLHLALHAPLSGLHACLQRQLGAVDIFFRTRKSDQEKRANESGDTKEDRRPRA